eukprot:GHVH01003586.1.p1 GENE.GHVH01003586.1~~GHVH01003586.1.p1  ORF type:complete len:416 (-),score=44.31 GHVH01003586.1:104-1351(-)
MVESPKSEGRRKDSLKYSYRPPINSHFYYNVLSPLCQKLVEYVFPDAATPDLLTLTGFACGCASTWLVKNNYFLLAGVFWQLYCIFDNCDGKQARRLGLSSHGGEFMDHATDSVITTMAGYVMILSCLDCTKEYDQLVFDSIALPFIMIVGNLPYFLGIWGQAVHGQVIMGIEHVLDSIFSRQQSYGENERPEWLSVDEYNFMLVPGICFARGFASEWFTSPNDLLYGVHTGVFVACVLMGASVIGSSCLIFFLLKTRRYSFFLLPIILWACITIYWQLSFVISGTVFSLISFEVLVKSLKIHTHTSSYMLYPILLELIFVVDVRSFFNAEAVVCNEDAKAQMIMICTTAGIMFTYKNVIHARNNEPNIPWIITKRREIEQLIRGQLYEFAGTWGLREDDSCIDRTASTKKVKRN